ncbi:glycosyltransferase family 4 protein [Aquabacterium sp. A7-Y]|uniref:glycosyltransferase family 4 protein n=1 Tax=Aquabacterium sp. A7-Y TaxID=1349605 RepID=UPI00223E1B32|nr:glycosyltransferase family 4 protein [Aquabacterium sp. A7-Y]MCW7536293.1 glycosyltransferase family 4 protein [Aquabacterium sp. A7-Y]
MVAPNRPMRIVQVLHSHGYGGAERHALTLMQGLREQGHEVLYAGPQDGWLAQACRSAGFSTEGLRMSGLFDLPSYLKLRRLLQDWRADIAHGHLVRGAQYVGLAATRLPGVTALCTAHATTAAKHMRRCRHIIAVSDAVKANLVRHGYPTTGVTVIHNGMPPGPPPQREAQRAALGIRPDTFAVFSAGRFIRDKGQDLMVRALRQSRTRWSLFLAGDTATPFGAEVRALAGEDPRIRFLGYRDDVQALLPAFDAYVSASRREAFPLALVEASAAALPIVATAVGGVPELVVDGRTGLLVPTEDAAALNGALSRLVQERQLAQALGQAAHAQYLQRFTVKQMVERTAALYRAQMEAKA